MSFLDNIFGSHKNEATSIEDVKSFVISDMEKKWKMHVEQNLQSNSQNVVSYLYAVQTIKFRASPMDVDKAKNIQNTSMAYGLVPLIKSRELNVNLTNFLEVYIYFYKNNTVKLLSNIVDGDDEKLIVVIETDLENAKDKYKTFIEEVHIKTFL